MSAALLLALLAAGYGCVPVAMSGLGIGMSTGVSQTQDSFDDLERLARNRAKPAKPE